MSLRVGLGASQADLDVQGEIDFDFFEENNCSTDSGKSSHSLIATVSQNQPYSAAYGSSQRYEHVSTPHDSNLYNLSQSSASNNFHKPMITVSCDDATGTVQKMIETVIPTPFNYMDNKCGKKSPTVLNRKVALSPRLKSKIFKDDNEISDDSSISSMSESESDVTSVSEDSFELRDEESDSMTDVSPLESPYKCSTPNLNTQDNEQNQQLPLLDECKGTKKEGVKFTDDVKMKKCPTCEPIDIHELVRAMKHLKMKQNISSGYARKCKSPVLTHNVKCRKNLSFTNEEVRRIDNDNQILLKKIIAQQNRVKPRVGSSVHVLSPAAVNRQRQQRQIELENLALLKRLESTKPSRDVSRIHLLHDYECRSSGLLSRASSRSSYPSSSSQSYSRTSIQSSGRSSAVSIKSSNLSVLRSRSLSAMNKS